MWRLLSASSFNSKCEGFYLSLRSIVLTTLSPTTFDTYLGILIYRSDIYWGMIVEPFYLLLFPIALSTLSPSTSLVNCSMNGFAFISKLLPSSAPFCIHPSNNRAQSCLAFILTFQTLIFPSTKTGTVNTCILWVKYCLCLFPPCHNHKKYSHHVRLAIF